MEARLDHQTSTEGDLSDCNSWRGITLLLVAGRVFNRMLLCRMRDKIDIFQKRTGRISPWQKLLKPDHNLKNHNKGVPRMADPQTSQLCRFSEGLQRHTQGNLAEYRSRIWSKPPPPPAPPPKKKKKKKIINIMKDLFKDSQCAVLMNNGCSERFAVNTGVKQGCILSPFLFVLTIDLVMRKCTHDSRGNNPSGLRLCGRPHLTLPHL